MRCDQQMGLTLKAFEMLKSNEIPETVCACCRRPFPRSLEIIGEYVGMFESIYPLYRHELIDGRHADEYLQASPWSSGPCFFLGLRVFDNDDRELMNFAWSVDDIDKA